MKDEAEAAVDTAKVVLQDLVVVVSLVRTLTESFGSASDLYRKLKRKSRPDSPSSDDAKGDREKRRHKSFRRRRNSSSESDRGRGRRHRVSWGGGTKGVDYSDSDEESICTSSSQVLAEYDRGYQKLGENQLQSQIIQLQHTLLSIHQDFMLSTYTAPSSSHSHLLRLIQTTRTARMASIQALHMQYQRMLQPPESSIPDPCQSVPGAFPTPPANMHRHDSVTRRPSSKPRRSSRSRSPAKPAGDGEFTIQPYPNPQHKPSPRLPPDSQRLFCVYARDLQHHPRLPLTDNYKEGGDNMCPFCHAHSATRPGKAWEIIADDCRRGHERKRRVFLVKNRFTIKCHREGKGFACVLCARFKESDTVCREIGALMEHLWREHSSDELDKDVDIFEIDT
ncbi:hypothetical protein BDU57DRAFT_454979 [Ampelomyces quisqualis]|uniref:C2H2-type domain-containing protein n=1 Tax=Ampelomyces quisqualis TaxID=50730 RepID=A0A6A5QE36_AMPQU|nr:hypothetical protein BDU57DRAFT_454979 [Ampelomyces quisqualis]